MRDVVRVRIDEGGADRANDVVGFADVESLGAQMREHLAQRLAVEPLAGDVVLLAVVAELEHAHDVRMLERTQPVEVALQRSNHAAARADVCWQHP